MITIREGNLFDAPSGIICHQVNCKGVMAKGVALQFKRIFPQTFTIYHALCADKEPELLGKNLYNYEQGVPTCCMFAQFSYSFSGRSTDYDAFRSCCQKLAAHCEKENISTINMPYRIGCGLGHGLWSIVYEIIEQELSNFDVVLWKYKEPV